MAAPSTTVFLLIAIGIVAARGLYILWQSLSGDDEFEELRRYYAYRTSRPTVDTSAVTVLRSWPFDWQHECPELNEDEEIT